MQVLGLVGPAYTDESPALSVEDLINWIPEAVGTPTARSAWVFKDAPGLTSFSDTAVDLAGRGHANVNGSYYAVIGTSLWTVSALGVATSLGTVAGTARCTFTSVGLYNAGTGALEGFQIVIANGEGAAYVYDTETSTFAAISDPDYLGGHIVTAIGRYAIFNTSTGYQISALGDADDLSALDFKVAESKPDTVVSIIEDHGELLVFCRTHTEVHVPVESSDFPFTRNTGATMERGCAAKWSVAKLDSSVFWLADNRTIVRADGYTPVRISTHAIEQKLQALTEDELQNAFAFAFYDRGHGYYYITFGDYTFGYDASTQLWHRRKTVNQDTWRVTGVTTCHGTLLALDDADGVVWELDPDAKVEGADELVRERVSGYMKADGSRMFLPKLELAFDTGNAALGDEPVMELRMSDNGREWGNWKQRSLGTTGQYNKRVLFFGLGSFYTRVFHVRVSDPVTSHFLAAYGLPVRGE